jgi:hypothetical protein
MLLLLCTAYTACAQRVQVPTRVRKHGVEVEGWPVFVHTAAVHTAAGVGGHGTLVGIWVGVRVDTRVRA